MVLEAENLEKSNLTITEKIESLDIGLKEQNIVIEQLRSQMEINEKNFKRAQTINAAPLDSYLKKKLPNPPKLFTKIFKIVNKKNLILDVFFSLMDKNSNGLIDADEISLCLTKHGAKIKKKDILEAIKIMGMPGNCVSLSTIEEYYGKYEYRVIQSSSSEEIIEQPKKVVEKLTYASKVPLPAEKPVVKMIELVKISEIKEILDELALKMQVLRLPKLKILGQLLGNNINPDELLTPTSLSELIFTSNIKFDNPEKVFLLSKFLIEPEKTSAVSEAEYSQISSNIYDISNKLLKSLKN